eukprot:gene15066-biopygen7925
MLQEERFLRIRTLLSTLSRVSTERIAQDLDVSRETVRRDTLALESQGILRRVHGGVVAQGPEPEPPLAVRQAVREREGFYTSVGIHSVPAVIINDQHLISGGQPAAVFEQALRQIASEAA